MLYCIFVVIALIVILGLLIWWFVSLNSGSSSYSEAIFRVNLNGDAVVPPVETLASGSGQAILSEDRNALTYNIIMNNLINENITQAEFRQGDEGEDGPLLKELQYVQEETQAQITGRWTTDDIEPLNSDALLNNQVYLIIKTDEHPEGLIRGQMIQV